MRQEILYFSLDFVLKHMKRQFSFYIKKNTQSLNVYQVYPPKKEKAKI